MKRISVALVLIAAGCQPAVPVSNPSPDANRPIAGSASTEAGHRASDPEAPIDQPPNPTDEEITQAIRQKLAGTKMAPNLQNLHVSTEDGVVKLRGTVKTDEEKMQVEEIARGANGAKSIESQIETE